jgi:hypothetical protein
MARKKVEEPLEVKAYSLPKDLIDFLDSYAWSRRVSASAAVDAGDYLVAGIVRRCRLEPSPNSSSRKHGPAQWWRARILALDPGSGTTGYAVFSGGALWEAGQEPSHGERGFLAVTALFDEYAPEVVVCESYRVYSDKALSHVNSVIYRLAA